MLKRTLVLSFLFITLLPCLTTAHTVTVTQGETVTLNLRVVNNGRQAITGLRASFEDNPRWILPADNSLTVYLSGKTDPARKPYVLLPFTFTVSRNAPPENSWSTTLKLIDDKGNFWTKNIHFKFKLLPGKFLLGQNYPNPFNPETWIPYQIAEDCKVSIKIFSSPGKLVKTLDLGHKEA